MMTGDKTEPVQGARQDGCGALRCAANYRNQCKWRSDVERCTQWEPDPLGLLWGRLRKGVGGHRFLRSYGVGDLVIDFYCPKKRLAIEMERDCRYDLDRSSSRERKMIIEYFGVTFMKVTRGEICDDMDGVMARIEEYMARTTPSGRKGDVWEGAGM